MKLLKKIRPAASERRAHGVANVSEGHALDTGRLEMVVVIINRPKTDFYMDLMQGFEVNLSLSVPAEGTAGAELREVLGLANTDKNVLLGFVREDRSDELLDVLRKKFRTIGGGKGIAFTVPLTGVIGVMVYGFLSNNEKLARNGSQQDDK